MGREKKVETIGVYYSRFKKYDDSFVGFIKDKFVFAYYEDEMTRDKKGLIKNPLRRVQSLAELSDFELYRVAGELAYSYDLPPSFVKYDGKILGSFFRIREGNNENRYFVPMIVGGKKIGNINCLCSYKYPNGSYIEVTCPHLEYDTIQICPFRREPDTGQQYYAYLVEK